MISFMLLGAPRSGTTWAANWLTTDTTLCLHDPLATRHYTDLDGIASDKVLGVACTGLPLFTAWVNAHPARKVIVHRPLREVNASLERIGLPPLQDELYDKLDAINGLHVEWQEIFRKPAPLYEYLLHKPFDTERHRMLCQIRMQPDLERMEFDPQVTQRLVAELATNMREEF